MTNNTQLSKNIVLLASPTHLIETRIDLRKQNSKTERNTIETNTMLSISFNTYQVGTINKKNIEQQNEFDELRYQLDDKYVLDLLDQYDCSPSELAETIINDTPLDELVRPDVIGDVFEYLPEQYAYYQFSSGGQHDISEDVNIYEVFTTEQQPYINDLLHMWHTYHLKYLTDKQVDHMLHLITKLEEHCYTEDVDTLANEKLKETYEVDPEEFRIAEIDTLESQIETLLQKQRYIKKDLSETDSQILDLEAQLKATINNTNI